MHRVLITLTLGCVLATYSTASGFAQEPDFSTKLDNTKVNQRDRQADERTADRQKENAPDSDTAKNVKRAIVKDKPLFSYAHNVKDHRSKRNRNSEGASSLRESEKQRPKRPK
jgi:hypothetical protein